MSVYRNPFQPKSDELPSLIAELRARSVNPPSGAPAAELREWTYQRIVEETLKMPGEAIVFSRIGADATGSVYRLGSMYTTADLRTPIDELIVAGRIRRTGGALIATSPNPHLG